MLESLNPHYVQTVIDPSIKTVSCVFITSDPHYQRVLKMIKSPKDEDWESLGTSNSYTYKTRLDLEPGDFVIVLTPRGPKVALVIRIHEVPEIQENSELEYKWVLRQVDVKPYLEAEANDQKFKRELALRARATQQEAAKKLLQEMFGSDMPKLLGQEEKSTD